jgi:2-dehydropantoate 2-reductase
MKIAIMGAGGVGGYLGGRLAEAGEDVSFIARGAHLDAMKMNGLRILSPLGDALINPIKAASDPAEIVPVDVILFCVKLYDLEEAAEQCRPLIKDGTAVISLLNGVDSVDRLRAIVGDGHVVGGLTYIFSSISAPGVIQHFGEATTVSFGGDSGGKYSHLTAFLNKCIDAGIDARIANDIQSEIWMKFMAWATFSGLTSLTRQPLGAFQQDPDLNALCRETLTEIASVAEAKGIRLPEDAVENRMALVPTQPPEAKPSTLVDLEHGRRLELEGQAGAVVRMGREIGIDTPINRVIYAALKPFINGSSK